MYWQSCFFLIFMSQVVLGSGENKTHIPIKSGDEFRQCFLDAFPEEQEAIDCFINDLKVKIATKADIST